MASALGKYVECPVCFHLFQGPKHQPLALSCMHVLCRDCYLQIKKDHQVSCPMCNAVSDVAQVKQDFRTESLVDDYLRGGPDSGCDSGSEGCLICGSDSVTRVCPKCNGSLCGTCAKSHKGKCCSGARKKAVGDNSGYLDEGEEVAKMKEQLETARDKVEQRCSKLQRKLRKLDKTERGALKKIDRAEQEILLQVKEHYERLRAEVESAKEDLCTQLESEQETENQKKSAIERHLRKLSDLSEESGGSSDCPQRRESLKNITEYLNSLNISSEDLGHVEFLVEVTEGKPFNITTATAVKVTAAHYASGGSPTHHHKPQRRLHPTAPLEDCSDYPNSNNKHENKWKSRAHSATTTTRVSPFTDENTIRPETAGAVNLRHRSRSCYNNTEDIVYMRDKEVTLEGVAYRLIKYKDEIWCNTSSELFLFTTDCDLVKKVRMLGVDDVRAIVKVSSSSFVVLDAGYNKGSLKLLNNQGNIVKTLLVGKFSDLSSHNQVIYALEREQNVVVTLKQSARNTWEEWRQIQLSDFGSSKLDTLSVFEDEMFVSSSSDHSVYIFDLNGFMLGQYGQSGDDLKGFKAGVLKYPKVCGRHSTANALVADCFNERLQVLSLDGTWRILKLSDSFGTTWDAVIDRNQLFVLHFFGRKHHLVKYTGNT